MQKKSSKIKKEKEIINKTERQVNKPMLFIPCVTSQKKKKTYLKNHKNKETN